MNSFHSFNHFPRRVSFNNYVEEVGADVKTHWWFLDGRNPPKDRGKRKIEKKRFKDPGFHRRRQEVKS